MGLETGAEGSQDSEVAIRIRNKLVENISKASLSGFMNGEVYTSDGKIIEINKLRLNTAEEKSDFIKRGFDTYDIESGIISIWESINLNPEGPRYPHQYQKAIGHYYLSELGNVLSSDLTDEHTFHKSKLDKSHIDALIIIGELSTIPLQIKEKFGSYQEFERVLGIDKYFPQGINSVIPDKNTILYVGGLEQFVRAIELKDKRELGSSNAVPHAVKDSLDIRDHFTKLASILQHNQQNK